ncbi:hypothetical protein M9H77_25361 [Catharanthus roseus]|uniref:Uncharacterized protein n=1 Tax=Catharanthus roseus TaxID=4058 RepID=A0ACC0A992_CATRO|nr:hypothetical protein M9H77_25361 [Catharanthus roseus]
MDDDEGGGPRLSKRFSDKGGEVDYNTKAGTAWSHSYLNQKPWHPLSYPNQRRKWIAEQTHAQKSRRAEEVAREYAQEQEFFRQTALVSKKEKEKLEMIKAVSFMYVRPPGYNAESAKAAEMADGRKQEEQGENVLSQGPSTSMSMQSGEEKKKPRPKDVFGRALPTEEQFEVLKNAPRLETGVPARSKPFGVEVRNVKCLRCGNYGHQSGDRECPLKDAIMPNEESRLKRDDPLTAILAQTDISEPLKWELKQRPGLSPPRGGFDPDDPNQQIVAEDIFDEYGGFLGGDGIPELLTNLPSSKPKKKKSSKRKHRRHLSRTSSEASDQEKGVSSDEEKGRRLKKKRHKKSRKHSESSSPENSDSDMRYDRHENRSSYGDERRERSKKKHRHTRKSRKYSESSSLDKWDNHTHHKRSSGRRYSHRSSSESSSDSEAHYRSRHRHLRNH